MAEKLQLVREEKLHRLLPGKKKSDRLEASGVALLDDETALVVFDNLNLIARVDLSLEESERNLFFPAPSMGEGFEDITIDHEGERLLCVIEAMEDDDGEYRGVIAEYDHEGGLKREERLETTFETANKGFEGLSFLRRGGERILYALCEGNLGTDAKKGGGLIHAFVEIDEGGWKFSHTLKLPDDAEFEDYAAISLRDGRLALVSQASSRVWIGDVDVEGGEIVEGSGSVYRFPTKGYCSVEGIAWLSDDALVMVSDRKKKKKTKTQADACAKKDQSIHIFRIPGGG